MEIYRTTMEPTGVFQLCGRATIVTDEVRYFPSLPSTRGSRFVELSQRDVKDAERLLGLLADSSPPAEGTRELPGAANSEELAQLASRMFAARTRRSRIFNPDLFGEPAWDFLLVLYMMDAQGPRLTVGRLSEYANVPSASTARWLAALEAQQLIARESHRTDARARTVRLTDKARELLEVYLSETLRAE
jgi:DNA-binding MarR family transcriptional regulator